ncbi:hypothetical protein SAMN04488103_10320 [Gemmobacter aquatilis]|uniref:Hemolysin-type calcium-binding repeat-containing protein n=1 Tax=Gemmobacter aquatilis TaxID=933059 RepID=A0A1H8DGE8_9RHOB|nr:calcium-binding protein [Gemmobacter aquatilis]SEN06256.1 hypothetical protein SAMN04488103_10320 [Gemmobacter aquatilis]
MSITGIPTDGGNNTVTVGPTGFYSVDGGEGTDTLVVNYGTLGSDVTYTYAGWGWYRYSDDFLSGVDFINFEIFRLTGGDGDDLLVGGALADTLIGGRGNDRIESGRGPDIVAGGDGHDTWVADYAALGGTFRLTLTAAGNATVSGSNTVLTGIERVILNTALGNDVIDTSAVVGNDVLNTGGGNDTVAAGRGFDVLNAQEGTDRLVMDWSAITDTNADIRLSYIGNGWYRYDAAGLARTDFINFEQYSLTGGAGDDWLGGGALNDVLIGGTGNDTLDGGAGIDKVAGDAGVDLWNVNTSARGSATTINLMTQTTNTGATLSGIERINYVGGNAADTVAAQIGVFNDTFATGDGRDLVITGRGVDSADGGLGDTDVLEMNWSAITDPRFHITNSYVSNGWYQYSAQSGDRLTYIGFEQFRLAGGAGNDYLVGGNLGDTLVGGSGDDTLVGGKGTGIIDGLTGNDLWSADLIDMGKLVFSAKASQTKAQGAGIGLTVKGIERVSLITGNDNDKITTVNGDDWVQMNGGNDVFSGGLGHDTADGGAEIDLLVLDYHTATTSVSNVYAGNGWYRYSMADGSADLTWINFDRFSLKGGSANDTLGGGDLNDVLNGGAGNDMLYGAAGKDKILGGDGNDTWNGSHVTFADDISLVLSSTGNGTVTGIGTTLSLVENIQLATGSGADFINLSAASGNDALSTGVGDDVIHLGRGLVESADGGADTDTLTLDASLAAAGVRMFYWGNGWTRLQASDGSYTADMANIERFNFLGSARSDRVYGFDQTDSLNGRAGTDFLNGGAGNDFLTGGTGADQFIFDVGNAGRDRITDAAAGDMIKLNGVGLTGTIVAGDGSTLMGGELSVSQSGGVTSIHLGLDGTAGADFHVDLTGSFTVADFQIIGNALLLV